MPREIVSSTPPCCDASPCCEGTLAIDDTTYEMNPAWITAEIASGLAKVPVVSTRLTFQDIFSSWKARWGIGRMSYAIKPGLYAVGQPNAKSPVLVTANYKMSFDRVRCALTGIDTWLLALDTKGINVWCAAGKGTFGTDELVERIEEHGLDQVVSHRQVILPQLGAPGIAAHEVLRRSGFRVIYGPVRASDIKVFLESNMKATQEMRTVNFTLLDRLVLIPVELSAAVIYLGLLIVVASALKVLGAPVVWTRGLMASLGALLSGIIIVPILLPFIPGRAFVWKGWFTGVLYTLALILLLPIAGLWQQLAYIFLLPPIAGFAALNFTGASTYTSLSGVEREVKIAIPTIIASLSAGAILFVISVIR